ncbi:MAG: hypothetical protein HQL07_19330, partial [Nitrospirae bacterium]|nr:hypothetical protein [Magnetococcales bacterium]
REVMGYLGGEGGEPAVPTGVVKQWTQFPGGEEGGREEWYLAGTQMERVERVTHWEGRGRIVYPSSGVIMALDPDIPRHLERILFRMQPERDDYRWRLDGVEVDGKDGWVPVSGHHRLELFNRQGERMDQTRFEVRGTHAVQSE